MVTSNSTGTGLSTGTAAGNDAAFARRLALQQAAHRSGEIDVRGRPAPTHPNNPAPQPAAPTAPQAPTVVRGLQWLAKTTDWSQPLPVAVGQCLLMLIDLPVRGLYAVLPLAWLFGVHHLGFVPLDVVRARHASCDGCQHRRVRANRAWCGRRTCRCPAWFWSSLRWLNRLSRFGCPAMRFPAETKRGRADFAVHQVSLTVHGVELGEGV